MSEISRTCFSSSNFPLLSRKVSSSSDTENGSSLPLLRVAGTGPYPVARGEGRPSNGCHTSLDYTCDMPTYEYECTKCGQHVEVFQRITEDPLTTCGACGGAPRKGVHPPRIVFKGSGLYATDNRSEP